MIAYDLPYVNLGLSSFLDGGPLRPTPGWYWTQTTQYYHADKFVNSKGKPLGGVCTPNFKSWVAISQLIYQSSYKILKGNVGIDGVLPIVLTSNLKRNRVNITNSGNGFGDLVLGLYLQWDPIKHNNRPVFIHRLEFDISFPTGKYKKCTINPGNGFLFIDPYWAGTLFLTKRLATSWRLHYLWSSRDKKTNIKAGDAIHLNYTVEYELISDKVWIGINGYYLKQIQDSKINNLNIPKSREQVFAIGAGALYLKPNDIYFFVNIYFESKVRNRPQGKSLVLRFIKHF